MEQGQSVRFVHPLSGQRPSSNSWLSGILSPMETITRKPYETDLTDEEWTILEPILKRALYGEKTKKGGFVGVVVGGVLCSVGLCVS